MDLSKYCFDLVVVSVCISKLSVSSQTGPCTNGPALCSSQCLILSTINKQTNCVVFLLMASCEASSRADMLSPSVPQVRCECGLTEVLFSTCSKYFWNEECIVILTYGLETYSFLNSFKSPYRSVVSFFLLRYH